MCEGVWGRSKLLSALGCGYGGVINPDTTEGRRFKLPAMPTQVTATCQQDKHVKEGGRAAVTVHYIMTLEGTLHIKAYMYCRKDLKNDIMFPSRFNY